MSELYKIKTVGDLVKELEKYDAEMPIKKQEIESMDIARLNIQTVKEYGVGGDIISEYLALVIR